MTTNYTVLIFHKNERVLFWVANSYPAFIIGQELIIEKYESLDSDWQKKVVYRYVIDKVRTRIMPVGHCHIMVHVSPAE